MVTRPQDRDEEEGGRWRLKTCHISSPRYVFFTLFFTLLITHLKVNYDDDNKEWPPLPLPHPTRKTGGRWLGGLGSWVGARDALHLEPQVYIMPKYLFYCILKCSLLSQFKGLNGLDVNQA